jgi:co-chaperonin GroES (HSP10)
MLDNFDTYVPIGHFMLLVPKFAAERTSGGLIIPEAARAHLTQGTVVKKGSLVENFDLGDEVIFTQHSEIRLEIDGRPYILVEDQQIALFRPAANNPDNEVNRLMKETECEFGKCAKAYLDASGDYITALQILGK